MLDEMTWSFSRLTTYERCPYAFYLQYIKKINQTQNAFSEYGTFCHNLLEKYFNNKLMVFELLGEYEDKFTQYILHDFPPNRYVDLEESYFEQGKEYFSNFDGLPKFKALEVEKKVRFRIDKYEFVGYIDLVAEDKTGKLHVIDHKSKELSQPRKSNWEKVETRRKSELYKYIRQLYIYCIPIIEQEGRVPNYLHFNSFRKGKWVKIPFDKNDYEESKQWALNIIKSIYNDKDMRGIYGNDWFCNVLCGVKEFCPQSDKFLGEVV